MAWAPLLKTADVSVGLAIDQDSSAPTIVDKYAWVRFQMPYVVEQGSPREVEKAHHAASVARAAALTWFALSRCREFSGRERPAFWRRVFCALQTTKRSVGGSLRPHLVPPMRDSIGFFDCDGVEFPRFMLALPGRVFAEQVKAVMDAFFGTSSTTGQDSQVARKMNELLSRLRSFQSPTNPRHAPVDLCVTLPSSMIANVDPIIQQLNRTSENPTRGSPFHLRQLRFDGLIKFDHDKDTESFSQFVNSSRVRLGPWAISSDIGDVTIAGFAQVLRSILRIDDTHQPALMTTLAFQHDRLTDTSFQALFSGLPFASSIHSLSLSVRNEERSFCMRELPWIAYAIFHPCARQSSWRHLELRDLSLTAEAQYVLSAMARGNNLLALLTGEHATSDEYVSGVLEAGSVVFTKPSESSAPMATITDFKTVAVDLCGISSTSDRATWNEWVAVVVPGYGLGWARSS